MAIGKRLVFGVGALALSMSLGACNDPAPTTKHLLGEGERCEKDDECETALCVALPREDKTCRRTCESGCHSEELCSTFGTNSNGGLRAGCVPNKAGLCLPCAADAECPYAADACLNVGGSTFCGRDCSFDGACPEGYACTDGVAAEGGGAPKQCIPKSATCSCIPQTKGMKRPCEVKNSFGTCAGQETCSGTGYEGCDARVPAAEACNLVDDDCNGQTDEGQADLTCGLGECAVTVKACVEGVPQTCTPKAGADEICNGKDDDCDGKTDEDFDLNTVDRCGSCDNACTVLHGTPGCRQGNCIVADCDLGWDDCDLKYETGCEANLNTDKDNCNGCLNVCNLPFADAKCVSAACEVDRCTEGHWDNDSNKPGCEYSCTLTNGGTEKCDDIDNDCNGLTDDGINLATDPKNCGGCNNLCPTLNGTAECVASNCVIHCGYGWDDCDPLIPGCETNIAGSNDNCGGCGQKCNPANGTGQCQGGFCKVTDCAGDWVDCNKDPSDGCEANLKTDVLHCGSCTKGCAVPNGTPSCVDGACAIKSCDEPFLNCDGQYLTGCNVNKLNDDANCGTCDHTCPAAPNSSVDCVSGACQYACSGDWQDCDTYAGCESNKKTDPAHCGNCGTSCPAPANADALCSAGLCGSVCKPGWGNCDTTAGCETKIDTLPAGPNCSLTPTFLGSVNGDTGADVLAAVTGHGEGTYRFTVVETQSEWCALIACVPYISAWVRLTSPPGAQYDMLVSKQSCGTSPVAVASSGAGGIADKGVCVCDLIGVGGIKDTYDVWVEVVYKSGANCGDWKLEVIGNTVVDECEASNPNNICQ